MYFKITGKGITFAWIFWDLILKSPVLLSIYVEYQPQGYGSEWKEVHSLKQISD